VKNSPGLSGGGNGKVPKEEASAESLARTPSAPSRRYYERARDANEIDAKHEDVAAASAGRRVSIL
jgi:hypothetical protein